MTNYGERVGTIRAKYQNKYGEQIGDVTTQQIKLFIDKHGADDDAIVDNIHRWKNNDLRPDDADPNDSSDPGRE